MDQKGTTTLFEQSSPALSLPSDNKARPSAHLQPAHHSKLGGQKAKALERYSSSPTNRQSPAPPQRAWTGPAYRKSTVRSQSHQQQDNPISSANKPALTSFFNRVKEGQRVPYTVNDDASLEAIYANCPSDSTSCHPRMVQQKKPGPPETMNGSNKRGSTMSFSSRNNNSNARSHNGNRPGFQTDSNISGGRFSDKRELQRWDAGGSNNNGLLDGGLEDSDNKKPWDQFAVNAEKFGVKTDYDENLYTTAIDRTRPDYNEKLAHADRLARKIEGSTATSAHAAEERVVDHVGGPDDGVDEEDKYSGVKRQDFPPLASQNPNKYTPPARRAPTGQSTVKGAPVDPAIISSQIRLQPNKHLSSKTDETKTSTVPSSKKATEPEKADAKVTGSSNKQESKPAEGPEKRLTGATPGEKAAAALGVGPNAGRNAPLVMKENESIEKQVFAKFKGWAEGERAKEKSKQETAMKRKLSELKQFAGSFKLGTPVPTDLIGIIAKDPAKQQEIQAKALKNAEEVQRAKEVAKKAAAAAVKDKVAPANKLAQTSAPEAAVAPSSTGTTQPAPDGRGASRPGVAPQHTNSAGGANRHPNQRQSYAPGSYQQQFRGDRPMGQNLPRHNQQAGHLTQRIRHNEQQRMSQPPPHHLQDGRMPPTGPAYGPRHGVVPPNHMGPGPRLNPNTQEFRPNAPTFYPTGPSAASSPRSALNNVDQGNMTPGGGNALVSVRRKVKSIDVKKCAILSHVYTFKAPQTTNRAWEENGGLRPPFDTLPTWKQIREEEKQDQASYKQLFERPPFTGTMATPNTAAAIPQNLPHQHQLPFHLQQGAQNAVPRQSPAMAHMQLHSGQPGHLPHVPFNNGDDGTRMMPSSSSQSYASPRPGPLPMNYPNMMNSPSHMQYSQPVMPGFMGPGGPPMNPQMRQFAPNPQFIAQHGQMPPPNMMQYMQAPLMQGNPPMGVYGAGPPQFAAPGPVPPPVMPGSNGYPSPGRPAAPMMAHQGSQQGPNMYGMSPGAMHYQPGFAPQQPGPMANMKVAGNSGPQQLGTSPQQVHQYGYGPPQNRGNNYAGKNFSGPHQGPSPNHNGPAAPQARPADSQEEAK